MLISILTLKLTVFSQIDTSSQHTKCFDIPVTKEIIKDLLSGDSAKAQLNLTKQELVEMENKVIMKDSVISILRDKESNYKEIIDSQNEKYSILTTHTKKVEKKLKNEKVKNKYTSTLSGIIIVTLTFFLLRN